MLQSSGHAVYTASISPRLPYVLLRSLHPHHLRRGDISEAVKAVGPGWSDELSRWTNPKIRRDRRKMCANQLLIFSRWCQVMLRL